MAKFIATPFAPPYIPVFPPLNPKIALNYMENFRIWVKLFLILCRDLYALSLLTHPTSNSLAERGFSFTHIIQYFPTPVYHQCFIELN